MHSTAECSLCQVLRQIESGSAEPHDTPLLTSPDFLLIPALGGLKAGHVMLVARAHSEGLGRTSHGVRVAAEKLIRGVLEREGYGPGTLVYESGVGSTRATGSCIVHTHVHIIPQLGRLEARLLREFNPVVELESLAELRERDDYILIGRGANLLWSVGYPTRDLPGQFLRREACDELGLGEWDWALEPRTANVEDTIRMWTT